MSRKPSQWAWVNRAGRKFYGKYGTANGLALDLLIMGDIKLTKSECRELEIRDNSSEECARMQAWEAKQVLINRGYKWKKANE